MGFFSAYRLRCGGGCVVNECRTVLVELDVLWLMRLRSSNRDCGGAWKVVLYVEI